MSCLSSGDPGTLMSSAHGNMPGMPARALSICSQKISDETDGPNGSLTKQYFLKGVLNAVSS